MPPKATTVPLTQTDLDKLQHNIMESLNKQFQGFNSLFEQVKTDLNSLKEDLTRRNNLLSAQNTKVTDLEDELKTRKIELDKTNEELTALKKKVADIEGNVDDVEAQERITQVLISGEGIPVYTVGENSTSVALNLVQDYLRLKMAPSDIISAERFGAKPKNQQPDKRAPTFETS